MFVRGYIILVTVCMLSGILLACAGKHADRRSASEEIDAMVQGTGFELPADAVLRRDENNGTIIFLRAVNLSQTLEQKKSFRDLQQSDRPAEIALAFMASTAKLFELAEPRRELQVASVATDELDLTHVKFQQRFKRLPVWGAELLVHLNKGNHVYLVQGRYSPTPVGMNTVPDLREDQARRIVADDLGVDLGGCARCRSALVVFGTPINGPHLAYHIESTVSLTEAWSFMVDAQTGTILDKYSTVQTGWTD